jgi:crotonobetainyl-CoA:carnitine CoA-transferase CaiB-like acyl-CoA transferase
MRTKQSRPHGEIKSLDMPPMTMVFTVKDPALLEAAKVPCGPINNLAEVFVDPHVLERGMVQQWQHPLKAGLSLVASPIKMSETPVRQDLPPPMLGQHTQQVIDEWLG